MSERNWTVLGAGDRSAFRGLCPTVPKLLNPLDPKLSLVMRIVLSVIRGIIFDGDDTLWLTEHLYDEARARARDLVERAGLDGEAWEHAQREFDLANVEHYGHDPVRFPTSALQALAKFGCNDAELRDRVADAARSVFRATAPLRNDSVETLRSLRGRGVRLALLTKGDPEVQQRRIDASGLRSFFDVVMVVSSKRTDDFEVAARQLDLCPDEVLSVGNSIRSDIAPSVAAGMTAVWIPAYVWEYEHSPQIPHPDIYRIETLSELLDLIEEVSPTSA